MPLNITRSTHLITIFFTALFLFGTASNASADEVYDLGEKVFKANCASCHKPDQDMTGPALMGAKERWEGNGDIYAWVKNSAAYLKTGNSYANKLFKEWNGVAMTAQAVTDEEIDAILYYADNYVPPVREVVNGGGPEGEGGEQGSSMPWMLVAFITLAVVALSLLGVNRLLGNSVRAAEGLEPAVQRSWLEQARLWAWNNKGLATAFGLIAFCFIIVQLWNFAFNIGVYGGEDVAHYRPEQPINFDHTLHAGELEINCQYCHNSAAKSKHAGIPSVNICMNCHKAVNEGRSEAGTADIQKIYAASGWDGKAFTGKEQPIKWVKVHNLPDHVYFNHSQHVKVAGLECQECHGPIDEEMTVAEQWAPLTMGWCINCHGENEVQMAGNGYYDEIQERLMATEMGHEELKKILEEDGTITVKDLGGWECAKCHY